MTGRHLVIVTSYPVPGEPVVVNRLSAYVNVLSERGWRVTLVATAPHLSDTTGLGLPFHGCKLIYVKAKEYNRKNFFVRGVNEFYQSCRLLREAAKWHPDVVLVTIPSIFLLLFSIRRFAPLHVVDTRDLVWEYLPNRPWHKGAIRMLLKSLSLIALRRADLLALSNPHELEYIQRLLVSKKILLVSNGIGRKQFEYISKLGFLPSSDGALRITYIGNVGLAQNLSVLISAVAGYSRFEVNIIGSGTDLEHVRNFAREKNVGNIQFHGSLPWVEAVKWYSRSDVLYAQLSESFATAMPSKLYEYLATGLPVVYGGTGAAVEILNQFSGVAVVEPDSPELLRSALLRLYEQRETGRYIDNVNRIRNYYIREDQIRVIEKVMAEQSGHEQAVDNRG